ncbi:MAG: 3-phosphoshikimate 1-carboxyvinyltransferase [Oscillospiraceae bacterium]|nr:3-phosphoshikimate 1-carboxyvinyltransferase [Oscillospiraceae bacterium]
MADIKITPSRLSGELTMPSSKSYSHRMIIAAALAADGISVISNISESEDVAATCSAIKELGARVDILGDTYTISGIKAPPKTASIDCFESGSTLRFLIPVAAALGCDAEYYGSGKLPTRPIGAYKSALAANGVSFSHTDGIMPFNVYGKLNCGRFEFAGDVSSQFITGLLFALPLCEGDSEIKLTSELESKPYVDMTVSVLKSFSVEVEEAVAEDGLLTYYVKGGQRYAPQSLTVEGDYSQAAFFFTANALGSNIEIVNLNVNSIQGDKKILEILHKIGYNKLNCHSPGEYEPFTVDVKDIPDLVPILAVMGCFTSGVSRIVNAKRLKIKESDRLTAIADALNAIGGKVKAYDDSLEIYPIKKFSGGMVDGCNDHRIVMAAAIASTMSSDDMIIRGYNAVSKSYPMFWKDFISLGGNICYTDFKQT